MVYEFNDSNFDEEVLKADKTVLVDVFATWCGPCKMMSPVIDEIAEELDVDEDIEMIQLDNEDTPLAVSEHAPHARSGWLWGIMLAILAATGFTTYKVAKAKKDN